VILGHKEALFQACLAEFFFLMKDLELDCFACDLTSAPNCGFAMEILTSARRFTRVTTWRSLRGSSFKNDAKPRKRGKCSVAELC